MAKIFLTGGNRLIKSGEWHPYSEALLVEVDTSKSSVDVRVRYKTPREFCTGDSHVFTTGSWDSDTLMLCTQTDIVWIDIEKFQIKNQISHQWFNDIHHVTRIRDMIHVVSSGLDSVVVCDNEGHAVDIISVGEDSVWKRFDKNVDYRKIRSTKPHQAHPTFISRQGDTRWVTRYLHHDVMAIDGDKQIIKLSTERVHDGVLHGGYSWFTSVDGCILEVDLLGKRIVNIYDLNKFEDRKGPLGWLRGVHVAGDMLWVGWSRIRDTHAHENIDWIKRRFGAKSCGHALPTRLSAYNITSRALVGEWNVEDVGLAAIYSVLPTR